MKTTVFHTILHVAGWMLLASLYLVFVPATHFSLLLTGLPGSRSGWCLLLIIAFLAVFFYLNIYLLLPRLYYRGQRFGYVLAILAGLPVMVLLPGVFHKAISWPCSSDFQTAGLLGCVARIWIWMLLWVFSCLVSRLQQSRPANSRHLTEQRHAELTHLRLQVSPHFLFNTLNNIYSLALHKHRKTPDAILKLSGMMRYVLDEAHAMYVPLESELEYLDNYIDLQCLRSHAVPKVVFSIAGDLKGKRVAPLLLINFIENAFKYGVDRQKPRSIHIRIEIKGELLDVMVVNQVVQPRPLHSGQLGIANARRRLELQYAGQHRLRISSHPLFVVHLQLQLSSCATLCA